MSLFCIARGRNVANIQRKQIQNHFCFTFIVKVTFKKGDSSIISTCFLQAYLQAAAVR